MLIDGVNMCLNFELTINSIHASEQYDIYITGLNAFLLSSDLETLFTGKTIEIKVFPFSFSEYLQYHSYKMVYSAFDKYIKGGGMSGSYMYKDEKLRMII